MWLLAPEAKRPSYATSAGILLYVGTTLFIFGYVFGNLGYTWRHFWIIFKIVRLKKKTR